MELEFYYENILIQFNIIYAKRKSICLKVEKDKKVTVISPIGVSSEYILSLVETKAKWIIKKFKELEQIESMKVDRKVKENSTFLYMGTEYALHIIIDEKIKKVQIKIDSINGQKYIIVTSNSYDECLIKKCLEKWYRLKCLEVINDRIKRFQLYFDKNVQGIKVKEQKRRWGSCTYDNRILFNWRIVMAPLDIIDYIVVHEMCHMDFKNHSKNYWQRVEDVMPDYKARHKWLKENGYKMTL